MHRMIQHIAKNHHRHLAILVAFIMVMLTSCAVKGSIKSFAGIPISTEQGQTKKNGPLLGYGTDACVYGEITDAKISSPVSSSTTDLLPAALLIPALFFLTRYFTPAKAPAHTGYDTQKISGSLPIFLQHRQLII